MSTETDTEIATTSVSLNTGRCLAYGTCVSILPEVFDLPKGSKTAVLLKDAVDEDLREDLVEAVRSCPARAIMISAKE